MKDFIHPLNIQLGTTKAYRQQKLYMEKS